jgi:hypothetical protein
MLEPFNGRAPANPNAEPSLGPDEVVEVRLPGVVAAGRRARDPHLRASDLVEGDVL